LYRLLLQRIDQLSAAIAELSARIEQQMRPFARQLERLATIPGVGQTVAEVIVAETGGNRWLTNALGTAAMAAARTKDTTYLGACYRRLTPRLGKKKALVAVQHSILTAIWHMLTNDTSYTDLGGDYFARLNPEHAMRRIVRQANSLGFTVFFEPIQVA
jgi:transposase